MLSTIVWATRPLVLAAQNQPGTVLIGLGVVWVGIFCYAKMSISSANICAKPLPMQHTFHHKKKDPSIQIIESAARTSIVKTTSTVILSSAKKIVLQISNLNQKQILASSGLVAVILVIDVLERKKSLFPSIPIVLIQGVVASLMFTIMFHYLFKFEQQADVLVLPISQPSTDLPSLIGDQKKVLFEKIKSRLYQIQNNKKKINRAKNDNVYLLKEKNLLQKEFDALTTSCENRLRKEYETLQQMRQKLAALEVNVT